MRTTLEQRLDFYHFALNRIRENKKVRSFQPITYLCREAAAFLKTYDTFIEDDQLVKWFPEVCKYRTEPHYPSVSTQIFWNDDDERAVALGKAIKDVLRKIEKR